MTTNNNAKTGNGRVPVIGPSVRYPVPISLNAAAWRGGIVHGEDGVFYGSNGVQWQSLATTDRVLNVIDTPISLTVGAGGDYATLNEALQYLSSFTPAAVGEAVLATVTLLAGYSPTEPVALFSVDLGWVAIEAEDVSVVVPPSATQSTNFSSPALTDSFAFIYAENSVVPILRCLFTFTYSGFPQTGSPLRFGPDGQRYVGMYLFLARSYFDDEGAADRGFSGFTQGVVTVTSAVQFQQVTLTNNYEAAILATSGSSVVVSGTSTLSGSGMRTIEVRRNSLVRLGDGINFRKGASDATSGFLADAYVRLGGVLVRGTSCLGGVNIQPASFNSDGSAYITEDGSGVQIAYGIGKPTSYTVATVPSAAAYPSHLIHVSNGDTGSPCLAVSNGTNWLRIALGAAVST